MVDDTNLQGADDQTPASPAQTGGQDDNQVIKLDNQTPEEVEFNSLTGSTQDRVKELYKRARVAEEEKERLQTQTYIPPAPITPESPDVRDAVRKLSEVGIATNDYVSQTVDSKINQIRWENEMTRLQSAYSGKDNEPQFVRDEVEDYIRTHPQYLGYAPEDVFKYKMFPEEFMGIETSRKGQTKGTPSLKPTKQQVQENAMTVEYIAERTDINKYPDAREWQEEHKVEIDKVLGQMS